MSPRLCYEDFEVGKPISFGRYEVRKEEIIAFARRYDPQPFHLDEEAAKATLATGLCASGFHTCAILMRMMCDGVLNVASSLGSPGLEEVKWLKPVRPGDVLTGRYTVLEKRVTKSRPDVGVCKMRLECLAGGDVVMVWESAQFLRLRHSGAAA
ncbi:MAG: MaoC family dehydratase [Hyphomicrobiaceae bacterium]|nr:MAG: MaoC family dehydratase [Hyphomicrobiaceae bacterium]